MQAAAVHVPHTGIRWIVAIALVVVSLNLLGVALEPTPVRATTLHTLYLVLIALAVYAWVLFPVAANLGISFAVFGCLQLVSAIRQLGLLQGDVAAFAGLLAVAAWRKRTQSRQAQRLRQLLDDLGEEHTVKDQAITFASQARDGLQKKLFRYVQLQAIAEELSNMTDLASIAELVVARAFTLIGKSDVCLLFLLDKERQELSLFASKRLDAIATIRAKHGDQFDRYVLRTHRPLLVNDVRRDFRFTVTVSAERPISSVIACPLLHEQSPEGVLRLDSAHPSAYTQDDLRFLDILLHLASTAMTNAKLFERTQQLAVTDGLTGLMLRRPFLEQLTRELTRSARSREAVSVLMVDVDRFKEYNDAFGHTAGDLILKSVGDVLREVVTPGGAIARYGGEEFAVCLPRLPRHQASDVAEKVRRLVAQRGQARPARLSPLNAPEGSEGGTRRSDAWPITVSIGVASFPEDGQAELELIRAADQRLYQAKRAGRNLVCAS